MGFILKNQTIKLPRPRLAWWGMRGPAGEIRLRWQRAAPAGWPLVVGLSIRVSICWRPGFSPLSAVSTPQLGEAWTQGAVRGKNLRMLHSDRGLGIPAMSAILLSTAWSHSEDEHTARKLFVSLAPATENFDPNSPDLPKLRVFAASSCYLVCMRSFLLSDYWQGFPGGSVAKESTCSTGELCSIPGLGRCPGEGNGSRLQCSCLENPMDRGAWWATVHRLAKSQTRLSDSHSRTVRRAFPWPLGGQGDGKGGDGPHQLIFCLFGFLSHQRD